MTKFEVTILGCGGAAPAANRHPTSQLVNINENYLLVDCGEGTQMQLRKYKTKIQRIGHIFISHLHGDHYFGLMGLLSTFHLLGRKQDVHVYGPKGLQEILDIQFKHSRTQLVYALHVHEVAGDGLQLVTDQKTYQVSSFPMDHRVPCYGYVFEEKERPRTMVKEKLAEYRIPVKAIAGIKDGDDFEYEGKTIPNAELTLPLAPPRKYVFCSDTAYSEKIIPWVHGANLMYHEATFTDEHKDRATKTKHSTAHQAATIAQKSEVEKLIIGHFSARYRGLSELLEQATEVFHNTVLAEEGEVYHVS